MSCNKVSYRNAAEAKKALDRINHTKNPNSNNKPTRYYYCFSCDKFHLTHRNKDEDKLFDLVKNPPENIKEHLASRLAHFGLK
jgi:hypothetical protein